MWYLVLSKRIASPDEMRPVTPEHLAWMKRQHGAGNVLFSGPTPDRSMGIYVIHEESVEKARNIAKTDPFHAKGLREFEIIEWEIHQVLGAGAFGS